MKIDEKEKLNLSFILDYWKEMLFISFCLAIISCVFCIEEKHSFSCFILQRGIGIVFAGAFLSAWVQIKGLIGKGGIESVEETMERTKLSLLYT